MVVRNSWAPIQRMRLICSYFKGNLLMAYKITAALNALHKVIPSQSGKIAKGAMIILKIGP
jgi:hypothetical protein